jgi:hypothetical protein
MQSLVRDASSFSFFISNSMLLPTLLTLTSSVALSVFGFPPGDSSVILSRFQKYGDIVSHSIGGGNWLKLEYSTKLSAEQALQQNGKIVHNSYMIGVKPVCFGRNFCRK